MKIIRMIFGIMLALVLCITPVAALTGDDFEVNAWKDVANFNYEYHNVNSPCENYIHLQTDFTNWCESLVTFKPANIPDAPTMVVNTSFYCRDVYLTPTVDEWEIKYYYSYWRHLRNPDPGCLNNAGVINLKEFFKNQIKYRERLYLELCWYPRIYPVKSFYPSWNIPEV